MIQNVLTEIGGIGLYGVVSICLFFLVFGASLIWTCFLKQGFLRSMSDLPLQDEHSQPSTHPSPHE